MRTHDATSCCELILRTHAAISRCDFAMRPMMQPHDFNPWPAAGAEKKRGTRRTRDARHAGRGTRDAGRRTRDAGRGTQDAGRGTRDAGRRTQGGDKGAGGTQGGDTGARHRVETRDVGRGTWDAGRRHSSNDLLKTTSDEVSGSAISMYFCFWRTRGTRDAGRGAKETRQRQDPQGKLGGPDCLVPQGFADSSHLSCRAFPV